MKSTVLRAILAAAVVHVSGTTLLFPDGPGPMPMCMPGTPCPNAVVAISDLPQPQ